MRIPNIRTIAALAPVAVGFWAITHPSLATGLVVAVTVGAAVIVNAAKREQAEAPAPAPVPQVETESRSEGIGPQAQAYLDGIRAASSLPQGQASQAPTWESQRVRAQITREV